MMIAMAIAFAIYWLGDLARALKTPMNQGGLLFAAGVRLVIMGGIWFAFIMGI